MNTLKRATQATRNTNKSRWVKFPPFQRTQGRMKAYIIGGGNSVTPETYCLLKNRKDGDILAVNFAYKFITPDALIWLDTDLYHQNKEEIDNLKCYKYSREHALYPGNICQFNLTDNFEDNSLFQIYAGKRTRGYFSGVFAISIALLLGYSEIYLLGFDGGAVNGKLHHHDLSRDRDVFSITLDAYSPFRGQPVYNLSKDSKITVFDKKRIEDVLD